MLFSKRSELFHQVMAILTVVFNGIGGALGNGWLAPVISILRDPNGDFGFTLEQCSWIASLAHIGKIFGAVVSLFLMDTVGRKFMLSFCATVYFIMWLVILFTKSFTFICICRLAYGVACAVSAIGSAAYLGEVSSPYLRGIFGTFIGAVYTFCFVLEIVFATYLSYKSLAIANSIMGFIIFLTIFGMVEPVQFLLMKGKYEQAERNFLWLKGTRNAGDVKAELEKIKKNTVDEISKKSSYLKVLTYPANYKSLSMMVAISVLVGSTGQHAIMSYASMMFSSTVLLTTNEFTILLGLCEFLVVTSTSFCIMRYDRRSLLLVSFSLMSLSHFCSATLYYINLKITPVPYFPWLIFTTIAIFASLYAFAYPSILVIRSELFPLSVKALGGCIYVIGSSATNFVTTKIFVFILQHFGIHTNFLIFSLVNLILVVFVYYALPETKNKTLIEIQEALEKKN